MRTSTIVAALAGVALTAASAAADIRATTSTNDDTRQESFSVENDTDLFGYYEAGFDDANDDDNWFYDYYELDDDAGVRVTTTDYDDDDYEYEWGDSDASDLGSDDAGDEGIFDF